MLRRLFFIMLLLLCPQWLMAAGFKVSPIKLYLSQDKSIATLRVWNPSDKPVNIQLQLKNWQQKNNHDIYENSRDLVVTPPIFTLLPEQEQIIRLGMRKPPDQQRERAYRLYLTEIPPEATVEEMLTGQMKLNIILRMGIPIFVLPKDKLQRKVLWTSKRLPNNQLQLTGENLGNGNAYITKLTLKNRDAQDIYSNAFSGYILPGQKRSWTLTLQNKDVATAKLLLHAQINEMEVNESIPVS